MGNTESAPGLTNLQVDKKNGQVYNDWTMSSGHLDGLPVTVFSAAHPNTSKKRPFVEKSLQASRLYRHPGLLRFIGGGVVGGGSVAGGGEVVMVMEACTPLHSFQQLEPLHITAGLASIVTTLSFLHDKAGVSHNNLSTSSIFVTSDGAWKLWGLEYSCGFSDLRDRHLSSIACYCHEPAVPPDDTSTIGPAYQHSRDVYSFTALVDDLIMSCPALADVPGLSELVVLLRSEGQHAEWSKRPRFEVLQRHPLFQHDFLRVQRSLQDLLIMEPQQRELFLSGVVSSLRQYPESVVASSVCGALLARPVLLVPNAAQAILPPLLTPRGAAGSGLEGLFSTEVYQEHIVQHVVELFGLHDLPVRQLLLQHLPQYVSLIPKDVLKQDVAYNTTTLRLQRVSATYRHIILLHYDYK